MSVHTETPDADERAGNPRVSAVELVRSVEDLAGQVLRPAMLDTDRGSVPASHVNLLRQVGALNHTASKRFGGAGLGKGDERLIHEYLAGACLNTWLVWAQHSGLAARVEAALDGAEPSHPLISGLLRGKLLAGAALSDVRRYPNRYIAAEKSDGGWRFSGTVSWVSGWGLNSALLTAAVDPQRGQVVLALVPVDTQLVATPLELAALGGSRTVRVELKNAWVEDALVLAVEPLESWRAKDHQTAIDAKPHLFGLATAVLAELGREPHALAQETAEAWTARITGLRQDAYALADADGDVEERLAVRVETGEALTAITRALWVARAGRSLEHGDTAQYYLRSAHFLLVQAQTDAVRAAQLTALTQRARN
ncbi:acyl-CoA dehydrogenase family protein [Paenarthrobacter sp. NPDC058040]|uniref:acyl-CoA dehydrogenase family protein n=1 Tax=unclassified Paenarthrobacter TaxID=2634190 RepID=UPI0036D898FE